MLHRTLLYWLPALARLPKAVFFFPGRAISGVIGMVLAMVALSVNSPAADTPVAAPPVASPTTSATGKAVAAAVPLNPQKTVLLDAAGKRLFLKGEVCLREGVLEMLACLKRTKEHESIFSVDTKAQVVHAGLLALGLDAGSPVKFQPEYRPAKGPEIEIHIEWTDSQGKQQRIRAQELIRNAVRRYWVQKLDATPADLKLDDDGDLRYDAKRKELLWYGPMTDRQRDEMLGLSKDPAFQKAIRFFHEATQVKLLKADWVFGGSSFAVDEKTGEKFYLAESGDLICVANFSSATIDLSIPSSATNDDLLYEAYTERLPPVGTPVTIELSIAPPKKGQPPEKPATPRS